MGPHVCCQGVPMKLEHILFHYHPCVSVLMTPNKTVSHGLLTALWASNWWFCPTSQGSQGRVASCQCLQVGHGRVEERMSPLLGTNWLVALGQWHWTRQEFSLQAQGAGYCVSLSQFPRVRVQYIPVTPALASHVPRSWSL